ncbi:MAG: hypothetical protein WAK55_20370 [Xanthobacteraceae bacterium]
MGWNWNDLTVAAGATDFVGGPEIDGYVFAAQGTQHVNYGSNNAGHITELWWDDKGWHYNDLIATTNSPMAIGGTQNGYVFSDQRTQHVVYAGADWHIHELWWDGKGWHHNDLTNATGGASGLGGARSWGFLDGYAFETQGSQHVVYRADDGHIIGLWWENGSWSRNDLTLAACVTVTVDSSPTGYAFEAQGTQHVNFRGVDGHIYELWWQDGVWNQNDLTVAANAPLALTMAQGASVIGISGYIFVAQGTQHVLYLGQDYHIHELWWDSEGWHHNDLTNAAGASSVDDTAQPVGYVFESQGTQHINYQGPDSHIHELWWDSEGWHHNDLTVAAGAPDTRGELAGPVGYAFEAQGTQHVIYRANNFHAVELYWTP